MAIVTRENIGTLHDILNVKLVKEDYMPTFEKRLKEFAKTASVPGFRKGMVPSSLIRKMAGQSIFNEEVMKSVSKELENYVKSERIAIFGQPLILNNNDVRLNMAQPDDVKVSFEIGLKPQFTIPAIDNKANIVAYRIIVNDKMVADETKRLCERYGREEEREAVTTTEDIIHCTFEKCDADGNVTDTNKVERSLVLNKFPAKLQEMLMGKIAGSVEVFRPNDVCTEVELPTFLRDGLNAGKEDGGNYYLLTLVKACELFPIEVGFELYSKLFPSKVIQDENEFKDLLRNELQLEYDRIASERMHSEIFETLVHTTPITLPIPFLKRLMRDNSETPMTFEQVDEQFGNFEHQLRWQLISEKIIEQNKIFVSREEVSNEIKARLSSYYGIDMDEELPWITSYVEKAMKDEKLLEETFNRLLTSKIFRTLETQFSSQLTEIEEDEFFKLPHPHSLFHQHHEHETAHDHAH